jgi:hypothetical protein
MRNHDRLGLGKNGTQKVITREVDLRSMILSVDPGFESELPVAYVFSNPNGPDVVVMGKRDPYSEKEQLRVL